jgi:hypothetical protein
MLRTGYQTKARLVQGSLRESDVFWSPTNGPRLTYPSVMNSLNWIDVTERVDYGGLGEIPGRPRPYLKPGLPIDVGLPWPAPWGKAVWFLLGSPLRTTDADIDDESGLPDCCFLCTHRPETQQRVNLISSGWLADALPFDLYNGVFTLERNDVFNFPCYLVDSAWPGDGIRLEVAGTSVVLGFGDDEGGGVFAHAKYTATVEAWSGPVTFTLVAGPLDPTWGTPPMTVVIQPLSSCIEVAPGQVLGTDNGTDLVTDAGVTIATS